MAHAPSWAGEGAGVLTAIRWKLLSNPSTERTPKMDDNSAKAHADNLVRMLIEHQPGLFGTGTANQAEPAKRVAQGLAALRAELIEQLKKQP